MSKTERERQDEAKKERESKRERVKEREEEREEESERLKEEQSYSSTPEERDVAQTRCPSARAQLSLHAPILRGTPLYDKTTKASSNCA